MIAHQKLPPLAQRPRCLVCDKPLRPFYSYDQSPVTPDQVELARTKGARAVRREDGARLRYITTHPSEMNPNGEPIGVFDVHAGKYGYDGNSHFHSGGCAQLYAEVAARRLPLITWPRKVAP